MVQLLILYYLSLKSTHGYEIQRFIQLNQMEEWSAIQSGSIYYAMNKLEKDGFIELVEKAGNKEKSKKIYSITEKGRSKLAQMALQELQTPLGCISSGKFLVYPIVTNLPRQEMVSTIDDHIRALQEELCHINGWYEKKRESGGKVEKATIQLMKTTVENQIEWHRVLAENLDETISISLEIAELIKSVDFSVSSGCSRLTGQKGDGK